MTSPGCDGYRFGRFEVWPRRGILLRDAVRIRLEELPFQFLLVLLESPGEVVSKETLRSRLWNDRLFGELDNGLHVAAAKLREALGEKAGAAQHIETIRRRGYRFNGTVEPIFSPSSLPLTDTDTTESAPAARGTETELAATDAQLRNPPGPQVQSDASRRRRYLWVGALCVCLLCSVVAVILVQHDRRSPLTGDSNEVLLGGFTNESGDDSYSGLRHAFRVKLEESPYLNLISEANLPQHGTAAAGSLQQQLDGCRSIGGKVLITGTIRARSQGYEIGTGARNCGTGRLVSSHTTHAADRGMVLAALDEATDQLRKSLGESGASLERFNVPLAQATTSSLAALRAFTLGEEKRASGQEFEAIQDYKLASDLDPQFALAYARLGTIYSNAAERTQSARYYQRAFDLRDHTSDRERLYIAAHYYVRLRTDPARDRGV